MLDKCRIGVVGAMLMDGVVLAFHWRRAANAAMLRDELTTFPLRRDEIPSYSGDRKRKRPANADLSSFGRGG